MKKMQVNQNDANTLLKPEKEFEIGKNEKYKVEVIINSTVYEKKAKSQLPGLYYLVL